MKYNKKFDKYNNGSFIKKNGAGIGAGIGTLGQLVGNDLLSGIGSGIAAGSSFGPIGAAVGGGLGLVTGLIGEGQKEKAAKIAKDKAFLETNTNYNTEFNANLDTVNSNPYGNQLYAFGGVVDPVVKPKSKIMVQKKNGTIGEWGNNIVNKDYTNKAVLDLMIAPNTYMPPMGNISPTLIQSGQKFQGSPATTNKIFEMEKRLKAASKYANGSTVEDNRINIEKNELQIDPQSGKILREYKGINPETGGLYESHNKNGQDAIHNLVSADPGSFIITKSKAKIYKDAVDNNDKIAKQTILQNIRNFKDDVTSKKYGKGDLVLSDDDRQNIANAEADFSFAPPPINKSGFNFQGALDTGLNLLGTYGGAASNLIQGSKAPAYMERGKPIVNPYKSNILNSMPENINLAPVKNNLFNQQNAAFANIDTHTSSSAIARANKNNVMASTLDSLGKLGVDQQSSNNQIAAQRGSMYDRLAIQDMQSQGQTREFNQNIDSINDMKDLAKMQQKNLGISQMQEVFMNNKKNKQLSAMDEKRIEALKLIYPRMSQSELEALLKV